MRKIPDLANGGSVHVSAAELLVTRPGLRFVRLGWQHQRLAEEATDKVGLLRFLLAPPLLVTALKLERNHVGKVGQDLSIFGRERLGRPGNRVDQANSPRRQSLRQSALRASDPRLSWSGPVLRDRQVDVRGGVEGDSSAVPDYVRAALEPPVAVRISDQENRLRVPIRRQHRVLSGGEK